MARYPTDDSPELSEMDDGERDEFDIVDEMDLSTGDLLGSPDGGHLIKIESIGLCDVTVSDPTVDKPIDARYGKWGIPKTEIYMDWHDGQLVPYEQVQTPSYAPAERDEGDTPNWDVEKRDNDGNPVSWRNTATDTVIGVRYNDEIEQWEATGQNSRLGVAETPDAAREIALTYIRRTPRPSPMV